VNAREVKDDASVDGKSKIPAPSLTDWRRTQRLQEGWREEEETGVELRKAREQREKRGDIMEVHSCYRTSPSYFCWAD